MESELIKIETWVCEIKATISRLTGLIKEIEQWKVKKRVKRPWLCYECQKPGHLTETCSNRKNQRSEDFNVKDEDPNALLVDV
ncbi:hypothetical protein F8M41_024334 [Gigaspora margarita]|uniref:CCHC-type domain-containing protein n=1 Tax=Gigaspora margarita TaxID=4874 RepID=A0A8H3XNE2_GIGMA|nr:hypothetical protein F8M41_024334 [Gigaspora margarita]